MRIAVIAEWLDAWRGGAETSALAFIHHLTDQGISVEAYTRSRLSPRPGMQIHVIPARAPTRALQTRIFLARASQAATASDADVVHSFLPTSAADVYQPRGGTYAETIARNLALRKGRMSRAVKSLTLRFNLRQRMLLSAESRMFAQPDRPIVVAISDYVVRQLQGRYQIPDERICVVPNGVDPDETSDAERLKNRRQVRELYGIGEEELLVILVAHNFKLKGLPTWMDALSALTREGCLDIRSLVVGKDNALRWQRQAEAKGLLGRMQFTGATQRVRAFFHAADVLVHPTYYDPCSRVVLEALGSGLPCVTTRFDGASERIQEGVNGFVLAEPDDAEALADRIRQLADAKARRRMAQSCRDNGAGLTMHEHAERLVVLYRTMVGEAQGVAPSSSP